MQEINRYEDVLACFVYLYKAILKVMNKSIFLTRQSRIRAEVGKEEERGKKSWKKNQDTVLVIPGLSISYSK